ncbi:unnamed protein product [Lactuca saligna]|uniref:Uncharacterized protein n=1 Tax=Lactuca saligna TaxID=75948 RepID=A0AA35ZMD4_LACSI|nr:unnamed protein product [Lactuca saligna]
MVVVFFTVVLKKLSEANSLPHLCIYTAAAADLTFIPDLDVLKDIFTMKLCVIRLWTLECYYNNDQIFSIQGNKIQGYGPNAYVYKFRKVLKEGEAFFIKNPNLAKIDEDVIGLVVAIGEIDARNEDRKRHKMRLQIQDANLRFCTNVYPSGIKALKDMKLAFIVYVSKYNVQRNNNQYTISKISDDETLIEELEKKFFVAEGGNLLSFEHGTTDCESQDNIFIKVYSKLSQYPIHKPKKEFGCNEKRALEDDIVLDVNDNMSSSKVTKVVGGEQHKFVNVKLEK